MLYIYTAWLKTEQTEWMGVGGGGCIQVQDKAGNGADRLEWVGVGAVYMYMASN